MYYTIRLFGIQLVKDENQVKFKKNKILLMKIYIIQ